jgi:hypothetical protein
VGHGHSNQLFGLALERTIGEYLAGELLKGVVDAGSQLLALLGDLRVGTGIDELCHDLFAPRTRDFLAGADDIVRSHALVARRFPRRAW